MVIVKIVLLSLFSIAVLFVLTKLMGARQVSEMSMFDYINGITIGSIAAEMATSVDDGFEKPLVAMIVYGLVTVLLSIITSKSIVMRRIISGTSYVLLENGVIYEKNMKKVKIDINEFLTQCRINGYYDIGQIYAAVFEENGKISFIPKSTDRYTTPKDFDMNPTQENICYNLIIDGKIQKHALRHSGKEEKWLKENIKMCGYSQVEDVLLAVYAGDNNIRVFGKS